MNPAESQETASNPIDVVEHILNRQAYELERRSRNEVVVEIKGRWNEMLLFSHGKNQCTVCMFPA